jgi:hypothetical protein
VVGNDLRRFLGSLSDRSYKAHFGELLISEEEIASGDDLLWPISSQDRLFQLLAETANSYGLPVSPDTITLDPNASEFIGFRKAAPHGIEFREGEDFVRSTPLGFEVNEGGVMLRITGSEPVSGWALDQQGRVCLLYTQASGFVPPPDVSLVRFLTEEEQAGEADSLNVLASLPATESAK